MARRARKDLRTLIWRRQRRAVETTINMLIERGLLDDNLTASGSIQMEGGRGIRGRLGKGAVAVEPFIEKALERVNQVPLSAEKPITVIDELDIREVVIGG